MKEMMKEATESLPEQMKGTTPSHKLEDYTGTLNTLHTEHYKYTNEMIRYSYNLWKWTFN